MGLDGLEPMTSVLSGLSRPIRRFSYSLDSPTPGKFSYIVDDDSLDPGLGAAGGDVQAEAITVAMPAGLADGLDR